MSTIGIGIGAPFTKGNSWSTYWLSLISATVEGAAPDDIVLTFPSAKNLVAADFTVTVNGANRVVSSASWAGAVLTLDLASDIVYCDVVIVTFAKTGQTGNVINNIAAEAEYTALLERFDTEPEAGYNKLANQLIKDFKNAANWESSNLWDRSDQILIWIGGKSNANYLLNWKGNTLNPVAVNTPIYTNQGIRTFNPNISGKINLNFNPYSEGVNVENISAAFSVLITGEASNNYFFGNFTGNKFTGIALNPLSNNVVYGGIACTIRTLGTTAKRSGLLTIRRTGTTLSAIIGGEQTGSETCTDQGFASLDMDLTGYNENGVNKAPAITRIGCFIASDYLTDNEVAKLDELVTAFYQNASVFGNLPENVVVCDGNSLTSGTGASDSYHTYPYLMDLHSLGWTVANLGVGSQRTITMTANAPINVDTAYYSPGNNNIVVAWEMINDLVFVSKEEAYNNFVTYCQARKAVGWKVVVCTLINCQNAGNNTDEGRAYCNTQLKANWESFADGIVLLDEDEAFDDCTDLTYYNADNIHLNDTGYAIVAALVKAVVLSV